MATPVAARSANPLGRGSSANPPTSDLTLLEHNEDTLRLAPRSGLGRLADQTGGFIIEDTNDLSAGLAEMREDLGAYYQLSYAPKNQDYDGRFRAITVKLKRPHGRLQARKGYLAVKTALPVPVLDYEAPALARLESGPRPTAVPLRLRGLQFPEAPEVSPGSQATTCTATIESPTAKQACGASSGSARPVSRDTRDYDRSRACARQSDRRITATSAR